MAGTFGSPKKWDLPTDYTKLTPKQKREVRQQYIQKQYWKCWHCGNDFTTGPTIAMKNKVINWKLFPKNFMDHPIHLQHCHKTGMTEGAVHAKCNAVLWQYHGR